MILDKPSYCSWSQFLSLKNEDISSVSSLQTILCRALQFSWRYQEEQEGLTQCLSNPESHSWYVSNVHVTCVMVTLFQSAEIVPICEITDLGFGISLRLLSIFSTNKMIQDKKLPHQKGNSSAALRNLRIIHHTHGNTGKKAY